MNPEFNQSMGSTSVYANKQMVARKFGVNVSDVVISKPGASLSGKKVIFDKTSERAYTLPSNMVSTSIVSLVDGVLTHTTGTVDLGALAAIRGEFAVLTETFTTGFTLRVKNEVISDGTYLYRWGGTLPKTVNAGQTVSNTGGIAASAWKVIANTASLSGGGVGVGADLIGIKQSIGTLAGAITRTLQNKNAEILSVKDYGATGDGVTDDTAAIQALLDQISDDNVPQPQNHNFTLVFPSGVYKVSSLVVGRRTNLSFEGGRLEPLDTTTARTHLIKFAGGYNKVYNLCVNMNYAMNYDTVVWCRTRYLDFIGHEIWSAKCVWTFGDPAWETDPVGGILGDSEIQIIGGWCNWCITHHRAYGVNTIVHFVGHECYSYKWSLPTGDSRKAAWEALPEITGVNCGAIIYLTGCFTGNYSGQQPNFLSKLQVTSTADYKNAYGRYMLSGTHVETGFLFKCAAAPSGVVAQDDYTQMLNVVNCTGYVSGGRTGFYIDCADALQSVNVINCNFYGNAIDKLVYALNAKVHVSRDSFPLVTGGDFFKAIQARHFSNYEKYNPFCVTTSSQSLAGALTTLKMTALGSSDLDPAFAGTYYNSATGAFTFQQTMFNVEIDVILHPASGAATDSMDMALVINGGQAQIINCVGGTPNAKFRVKKLMAGDVIQVQAVSYNSRSLDGTVSNQINITGSC